MKSKANTGTYCPGCGRKHPKGNNYNLTDFGKKICPPCENNWGDGLKLINKP